MTVLRRIGVLGGMSPDATILLQRKLLDAVSAKDDADHIPLLIDMNPQVPSRIAHLIDQTGENPGPTLATMARRLEQAGAKALAMPCNTAHHYAGTITSTVSVPLLNMVGLAVEHAAKRLRPGGAVGLLASPACRYTRLFDRALDQHGLTALWPPDDAPILAAIRAIKVNGACDFARDTIREASRQLMEQGAKSQFIACSEFSLIAQSVHSGVKAVDTLDLLVRAIVEFSRHSSISEPP